MLRFVLCNVKELVLFFVHVGIPPHVDTHSAFEGEIVSLSVGSHVCVLC